MWNTRKTERGAKQFLLRLVVRAAPFALLKNTHKTERGARQFLIRLEVRAVRVFTNGCCPGGIGDPSGGLSGAYLPNLVDFLKRADSHGLFVVVTGDSIPETGGYNNLLPTDPNFAGMIATGNGETYNLSNSASRQAMMDDNPALCLL